MTTDAAGAVVARYDYLPFGQPWPSDQDPEPRRFAGMERDLETGSGNWEALHYAGARYYHSQTGRFTSPDPILLNRLSVIEPQRWNRYAYGLNNPTRYVDPDGRCAAVADTFICTVAGVKAFEMALLASATVLVAASAILGEYQTSSVDWDDLDALAEAGRQHDRGGLTTAGRGLEKHGGRKGSRFPRATGHVEQKNDQGQDILEDIITHPGTTRSPNRLGGQDFIDPSGRGARFNGDGGFRGFLEPK